MAVKGFAWKACHLGIDTFDAPLLFRMGAAYWSMWADSKSVNCGFDSHHLCKARPYNLAGVDRANAVACDGKDCAHRP